MGEEDKRNKLDESPFTFEVSKDKNVFIFWRGKRVTILKEKVSDRFLERIRNTDQKEAQLIMAKVTGNFKRGNEKNK
ncbi:hypothetical protein [Clostridium sp. KNHs205]|uniref:hypothetical protein n=1 Tax=Clostridium sp. KNHs205 TaxID=1449050 RepID=UPI00051C2E25|nr:hypothetical protein [Clostridium sp. KNHs205]